MPKKYEIIVNGKKKIEVIADSDKEIEIAEKLVEMIKNKYGVKARIRVSDLSKVNS